MGHSLALARAGQLGAVRSNLRMGFGAHWDWREFDFAADSKIFDEKLGVISMQQARISTRSEHTATNCWCITVGVIHWWLLARRSIITTRS
jgi:hypothetical protein